MNASPYHIWHTESEKLDAAVITWLTAGTGSLCSSNEEYLNGADDMTVARDFKGEWPCSSSLEDVAESVERVRGVLL